jgi:hypothetical protein
MYTEVQVRCFVAKFLVLVFGWMLMGPALLAATKPAPEVPACCRKDGKHHCARNSSSQKAHESHGPSVRNLRSECPHCPSGSSAPAALKLDTSTPQLKFFSEVQLATVGTRADQTEARFRLADLRAWQQRGPPPVFFL